MGGTRTEAGGTTSSRTDTGTDPVIETAAETITGPTGDSTMCPLSIDHNAVMISVLLNLFLLQQLTIKKLLYSECRHVSYERGR